MSLAREGCYEKREMMGRYRDVREWEICDGDQREHSDIVALLDCDATVSQSRTTVLDTGNRRHLVGDQPKKKKKWFGTRKRSRKILTPSRKPVSWIILLLKCNCTPTTRLYLFPKTSITLLYSSSRSICCCDAS